MKTASVRLFTAWWIALFALLLAACGSDNNPVTPTTAGLNQVNALNSTVPDNIFSATLTGNEEVPPVTTKATATAAVIVDLNTRQMKATVVTTDITATGVNAHEGIKGVNGPEVIPFTQTSPGSGVWTAASILTAEQLDKLKAGNYYINAKSAVFPDGEIRGQVLAQLPKSGSAISTVATGAAGSTSTGTTVSQTATGSTTSPTATTITGATGTTPATTTTAGRGISTSPTSTTGSAVTALTTDNLPLFFTNIMSGSLVIPGNSSSASAIAITLYKPADKSLASVLLSTGLTGTAANLRQAAANATGPVVGSLTQTAANSGIWTARNTLNDNQVKALNAGNMYYEILSAAFPNGEIRGQIVKTEGASKVSPVASTSTSATTGTTAGATTAATTTGAATMPAATTPAATTPAASTPATTMPATTTGTTTTPVSTTPAATTPAATTPATTMPVATTGTTTSPASTMPAATTPAATTPATTTPAATTGTATTPVSTTPAATTPAATMPATTTPVGTTPVTTTSAETSAATTAPVSTTMPVATTPAEITPATPTAATTPPATTSGTSTGTVTPSGSTSTPDSSSTSGTASTASTTPATTSTASATPTTSPVTQTQ